MPDDARRPASPTVERYYSTAEIAALLNVSHDVVNRLCLRGELRSVQFSERKRRIPESALAEYLATHTEQGIGFVRSVPGS